MTLEASMEEEKGTSQERESKGVTPSPIDFDSIGLLTG
jgi:hypothetical protein